MATDNPTGRGSAVALTIPTHHAGFLRDILDACREGAEGDLAQAGERHPHRERVRREADAYGRLLKALESRAIVPDDDVVGVVAKLAEQTDASNDYEQVVLEHRALCGLLGLLEEGRG